MIKNIKKQLEFQKLIIDAIKNNFTSIKKEHKLIYKYQYTFEEGVVNLQCDDIKINIRANFHSNHIFSINSINKNIQDIKENEIESQQILRTVYQVMRTYNCVVSDFELIIDNNIYNEIDYTQTINYNNANIELKLLKEVFNNNLQYYKLKELFTILGYDNQLIDMLENEYNFTIENYYKSDDYYKIIANNKIDTNIFFDFMKKDYNYKMYNKFDLLDIKKIDAISLDLIQNKLENVLKDLYLLYGIALENKLID